MRFLQGLSKTVVKLRYAIIVFWVAAAVVILLTAPELSKVASSDETSFLPPNSDTLQATALYKQLFPSTGNTSSFVLVLTDNNGISDADRTYGRAIGDFLMAGEDKYDIQDIKSPFTDSAYEAEMISADGKAAVIDFSMKTGDYRDTTNAAIDAIHADLKGASAPQPPAGLTVNMTGDAPVGQEYIENIKTSLNLTTKITVALIVVILLIIYRSPLAPVLPLSTIGLSFLISRGFVALLTTIGYKVSSFTEIFMIAVLFGAGTDYGLLLISRYREEIVAGHGPRDALTAAFPHTSVAIVCSGCTVIIGFIGMGLAKFGLFNTTGPSIAIGVGVTLLAVLTLTPSLIAIFGERIFWPAHPSLNREKELAGSPFWNRLSKLVTSKPVLFMLVTLAVFAPFMILATNITRSFDILDQIPQSSDTVLGYNALKAHFNQGEMMPVKVVLKSDKDLWANDSLQAIDNVAAGILKVDGVAKVRTATRPGGDPINELSLPSQINTLTSGIGQSGGAFDSLTGGFSQARDGVDQVASGIDSGVSGLGDLSNGTTQASGGVSQVQSGLGTLSKAESTAIGGLGQIKTGMSSLAGGIDQAKAGLSGLTTGLQGVQSYLNGLAANPVIGAMITADPNYQATKAGVAKMLGSIPAIGSGLDTIKGGVTLSQQSLDQASAGLKQIKSGIDESKSALSQVQSGLKSLKSGQDDAASQLNQASSSLRDISSGLDQGIDGINQMKSQLSGAGQSASDWASGLNGLNSVFYLPADAFDKYPQLKGYMQMYISDDGHGVTFDVILSQSPYSPQALDSIPKIRDAIQFSLKNGPLEGAEYHVAGTTGGFSELRQITESDFITVMVFVLLGIFIVLALLLRSITAPIYLIFTILVSYLTTLGISYLVFQVGFGATGLGWAVPFFSFCLLVALGVDYNIFLMTRVREEYRPGDMTGGTARALASTGKIITSCGIIMAGTFGAMLFSPVSMLVQIGFATVVGLLIDTFLVRCMLVPAIAVKLGELNWWPGKKMKLVVVEKEQK